MNYCENGAECLANVTVLNIRSFVADSFSHGAF